MAFASKHINVLLTGEANDYVGKGLSGATVAIKPLHNMLEEQVLIGNTCLYGATSSKSLCSWKCW